MPNPEFKPLKTPEEMNDDLTTAERLSFLYMDEIELDLVEEAE